VKNQREPSLNIKFGAWSRCVISIFVCRFII